MSTIRTVGVALFALLVIVGGAIAFHRTLTETLILKGAVRGVSLNSEGRLAFHFFDKATHRLIHRAMGDVRVEGGEYEARVPIEPIKDAGEVLVAMTAPEVNLSSDAEVAAAMVPLIPVWLQSSTPGTQQIGHANISGTLIAGAVAAGAFRLTTGAGAGRVLTSDASGNASWQAPPPPSGSAGGDLSGTYPNPVVAGLQTRPVSSTAPNTGQVLKWSGAAWVPADDLTLWQPNGSNIYYNAGNVGIGTISPRYRLHNTGDYYGRGHLWLYAFEGDGQSGTAYLQARDDSATSSIALRFRTKNGNGLTDAMHITPTGNVGIGTNSPAYRLHVETGAGDRAIFGLHTATSGPAFGGWFESAAPSGRGVFGLATSTTGITFGVQGQSTSTDGTGVFGWAPAATGTTYGVRGQSDSTSGTAVFGRATATTGSAVGGRFESDSISGRGVVGLATAGTGITYGVFGQSDSIDGIGVRGLASATNGQNAGVLGRTFSTNPFAFGVYGVEPPGSPGHAVFAEGSLGATGVKSFQIDHPLDPENYFLSHFCSEGPEPYNVYRGNVVTDANGYATIALPDYFESINRDPTYHLTIVDGAGEDFVQVRVVRKIQNNQFTIRTSAPHVEVSWEVKAIRNDRWVQAYGYQTVQEKEDEIKGKYLSPELYGKPKERGIHYRPEMETRPGSAAREARPAPGSRQGGAKLPSPKAKR